MFHAEGQTFAGDHLDLSFRATDGWTQVDPSESSPPSLWLSLGDPVAGPAVQLGLCPPVPGPFWLDTHYHASDQFRAVLRGDFHLQRKHMKAGDFGYHVAGIPYREGLVPGSGDPLWMFAVHGDRRGARSTITRSDGSFPLGEVGEDQLDRPVASPDDPYWNDVPGGAKGVPALTVSTGRKVGGFLRGNFADAEDWPILAEGVHASIGLIGDKACGPALLALHVEAGHIAIPAHAVMSETIFVVVRGGLTVGKLSYAEGDVRVQRAGATVAAAIADEEGADIVYMIADRRQLPVGGNDAVGTPGWFATVADECRRLVKALDEQAPLIRASR